MNRDNQQETPTEAEIAWLAGIVEGEGSVMLSCYMREMRSKPKVGVEIKVYNTDAGIVRKAVDVVQRLGVHYHLGERKQKPITVNGKTYTSSDPMLTITVKRMADALRLAVILRPWFFGQKGPRLDLIIQYLNGRLDKIDRAQGNKRIPLYQDDVQLVVDFYRNHVRVGRNLPLVEGLLRDCAQSPEQSGEDPVRTCARA